MTRDATARQPVWWISPGTAHPHGALRPDHFPGRVQML